MSELEVRHANMEGRNSTLSADTWGRLHEDIIAIIPFYVTVNGGGPMRKQGRIRLSQLSFVSHSWMQHIRPLLFQDLTILSSRDLQTLYGILQSPVPKDLAMHVESIQLQEEIWSSVALAKQLSRLLSHLPALKTISYVRRGIMSGQLDSGSPGLDSVSAFPLISRRAFLQLRQLSRLELTNQKFQSLSSLIRAMKCIPALEFLQLHCVSWVCSSIEAPATSICPVSHDDFSQLQHISAVSCPQYWQLLLLMTTPCAAVNAMSTPSPDLFLKALTRVVMLATWGSNPFSGHNITIRREAYHWDSVELSEDSDPSKWITHGAA